MLKSIKKALYKVSRTSGKLASKITDIETLASGDPEKIIKRVARKKVYKESNKIARKINNKLK